MTASTGLASATGALTAPTARTRSSAMAPRCGRPSPRRRRAPPRWSWSRSCWSSRWPAFSRWHSAATCTTPAAAARSRFPRRERRTGCCRIPSRRPTHRWRRWLHCRRRRRARRAAWQHTRGRPSTRRRALPRCGRTATCPRRVRRTFVTTASPARAGSGATTPCTTRTRIRRRRRRGAGVASRTSVVLRRRSRIVASAIRPRLRRCRSPTTSFRSSHLVTFSKSAAILVATSRTTRYTSRRLMTDYTGVTGSQLETVRQLC
uniref:Uncharacterized protein n=1 Tax=Ixodes ricinus TaxID=34613 RepID=A0A6B0V7U1_IXORI